MKVELILATPEKQISDMAKICYANTSEKNITHSLIHSHKHLAVLRFAYMTVSVKDISVAAQNQFVRSKHLDFLVQSKRYVDGKKGGFKFIYPDNADDRTLSLMREHWEDSINKYNALLNQGVKKEDARAILPANTSTSMNVTGNLQGWNDFFKLRLHNKAQKEIRDVANAIWDIAKVEFPNVFTDDLYEEFAK